MKPQERALVGPSWADTTTQTPIITHRGPNPHHLSQTTHRLRRRPLKQEQLSCDPERVQHRDSVAHVAPDSRRGHLVTDRCRPARVGTVGPSDFSRRFGSNPTINARNTRRKGESVGDAEKLPVMGRILDLVNDR